VCVGRVDSHDGDQLQPHEGYVSVGQVESIDQLTPRHMQAFRDLANKPLPPLPKHFLKTTKWVQNQLSMLLPTLQRLTKTMYMYNYSFPSQYSALPVMCFPCAACCQFQTDFVTLLCLSFLNAWISCILGHLHNWIVDTWQLLAPCGL